tara:strand:+ start:1566 stop:2357 length:792 start_codon:yes stop_codon:yes gene_type:complete
MMDTIDDHAPVLGSGAYNELALQLVGLNESLAGKQTDARRTLAKEMILEKPLCISTCAVYEFTHEPTFMTNLVRSKALALQAYSRDCAAVMGGEWKSQLAEGLLECDSPRLLVRLRLGVLSLLVARSGFLPQIVQRLNDIKVTPQMLCPRDLGASLLEGDCGRGPTAEEFLCHEPRMLRWLLGRDPLSPWPALGTRETQPHTERRLIRRANLQGGDSTAINAPCRCPKCAGVAIPTLSEGPVSLTPSEYDEAEDMDQDMSDVE